MILRLQIKRTDNDIVIVETLYQEHNIPKRLLHIAEDGRIWGLSGVEAIVPTKGGVDINVEVVQI